MKTLMIGACLGMALLAAGCSRNSDVTIPASPDMGYAGDAASLGGLGGSAGGAAAGGTLPGTSIGDRVFFAVDQTTLSQDAMQTLNAQVGWLKTNQAGTILIEGHADERGTGEYNMALGSSRASAVRNYMVSQGVPDSRISIITYGRERPVATCDNESCWSVNRRAVTVVTGGPAA